MRCPVTGFDCITCTNACQLAPEADDSKSGTIIQVNHVSSPPKKQRNKSVPND